MVTGRLQNVRVEQSPRTPELIAGLVAAIFRADSVGALPSRPPALSDATTEVHVRLFGTGSSLPTPTDPAASVLPVAEPRLAFSRVDEPAWAMCCAGAPRYPVALKREGIQGSTPMVFIVDASGRAVPGSARTLRASHP